MTESTQQQAPATDPMSCPECSKLLAFAELDEMIAKGVASPGQMTQHDELAREISGNPQNGESVAAVLARKLAEQRHRENLTAKVEAKADQLLQSLTREFGRERLAKDRSLAILPSGAAISLQRVRFAFFVTDEVKREALAAAGFSAMVGDLVIDHFGSNDYTIVDGVENVAALRAALLNIGVAINAPTIAGEDRDGDGRTGE